MEVFGSLTGLESLADIHDPEDTPKFEHWTGLPRKNGIATTSRKYDPPTTGASLPRVDDGDESPMPSIHDTTLPGRERYQDRQFFHNLRVGFSKKILYSLNGISFFNVPLPNLRPIRQEVEGRGPIRHFSAKSRIPGNGNQLN